ncbi:mechanosensitive ion channel family protein [Caballeronia sp. INDeC2]|uniref:mechanosensitive ion channel family protein n=1 Tax=Caballeronia sp. INDeC2 TaxID=2921747 RepID=UPI00202817DA|nr:mechanosensitive ion channel family protein [Caballeronia sp. INDeC2]
MLTQVNGIAFGVLVVLADFVAWRILGPGASPWRKAWRVLLFVALSYILFANKLSPLATTASTNEAQRFVAQALGIVWWLQCAQFVILVLDTLILPQSWHTQRLFHDVAAALIFLAAGVAAFGYVLGLPVSGLVATSGAIAVVFGLAIQNTLNDMFSGLVLNATEPFKLDDWVGIGDVEGRVVESNWRATKLINGQGNLVVVPNSVAAKATIVNLNEPPSTHGVTLSLEIDPQIRPAAVLNALQLAASSSADVLDNPAPLAIVKAVRANSIDYELLCYVGALAKKVPARNALYDLAHRHLSASGVTLRPLAVPVSSLAPGQHRRRALRAVDIFSHLDDADLDILEAAMEWHQYEAGEEIYASGSEGRVLTIIDSGVASVTLPGDSGEVEVRRMVPGDTIGQSAVLSGATMHATVRARTRVTVYRLTSDSLTPIVTKRPDVGRQMCRVLSEHRETEEKVMSPKEKSGENTAGFFSWLEDGMRRLHQIVAG